MHHVSCTVYRASCMYIRVSYIMYITSPCHDTSYYNTSCHIMSRPVPSRPVPFPVPSRRVPSGRVASRPPLVGPDRVQGQVFRDLRGRRGRYERLAEYGWKPHRDVLPQKAYHRPQCTAICVKNRGTVSSNSRFQTVLLQARKLHVYGSGTFGAFCTTNEKASPGGPQFSPGGKVVFHSLSTCFPLAFHLLSTRWKIQQKTGDV